MPGLKNALLTCIPGSIKSFFVFAIIMLGPTHATAFASWQTHAGQGEAQLLLRGFAMATSNPEQGFLYRKKNETSAGGLARLIMQHDTPSRLQLNVNAYASWQPAYAGMGTAPAGTERSSMLQWRKPMHGHTQLVVDQLHLQGNVQRMDITLGRQPVNLATTFYFTPNDFFAPFAADTFYRSYKPGVDALRLEVRTGDLSQLSLIGALGYQADRQRGNGWSTQPSIQRSSAIAHYSMVVNDQEWAVLGGRVRQANVLGASLQGEYFSWLGLRAEGHITFASGNQPRHLETSLGLEHRFASSLELRSEYFYHGAGARHLSGYTTTTARLATQPADISPYLARHYLAFGGSYEVSPLLTTSAVLIRNMSDASLLGSLYAVYSLSDESELVTSLSAPFGRKPLGASMQSEFGSYPRSASIEWRGYF